MRSIAVLLLLASPAAAQLSEDSFAVWRRHLLPEPSEVAWRRIPWISSFAAGVREAQEQKKPMLVWVMNGHPVGCT